MEVAGAGAAALNRAPCGMMSTTMIKSKSAHRNCIDSKICFKPRGGFHDTGHVLFYQAPTKRKEQKVEWTTKMMTSASCGMETEKKKKKKKKKEMEMKKLKGLTKDLSMLSGEGLIGEEGILEAAEALMKHLKEMKAKEKVLKKTRKMEKEMMKAAGAARKAAGCESSSSSSESSDSGYGEVIGLASLRRQSSTAQFAPSQVEAESTLVLPSATLQLEESKLQQGAASILDSRNEVVVASGMSSVCTSVAETMMTKKIEVCMGGKCKKSGAAQLVEEFDKVVGEGAQVVGCKCMGKCRDGPNVRVLSSSADMQASCPPLLCIGVGLEDVGVIVANFLAGDNSSGGHFGLAAVTMAAT